MTLARAGALNRRVTLQQRSTSQDSYGEPALTWTDLVTVWAAIEPLSGRELELAQKVASEVTHRMSLRYQSTLTDPKAVATLRARYHTRVFDIHAVMNEEEANVLLHLLVSEGVNEGN